MENVYKVLQNTKKGNAVFTFPNCPIKCAGAPQKIAYISDHYFRKVSGCLLPILYFRIFIRVHSLKMGRRNDVNIIYNTPLPNIFGVPHYAKALWKVVKERDIKVNLTSNLVEVKSKDNVAVFEDLKNPGKLFEIEVNSSVKVFLTWD